MSTLAVLMLLAASAVDTSALGKCLERNDRACMAALLSGEPHDKSPEFLSLAAKGFVLLGNRAKAIQAITAAVAQRPNDAELLMTQGWVYQRCGDQVAAIQSFLLASKAGQPTPSIFYELGMSFFLLHEFDRAAVHFRHAIQLRAEDGRADFMLGVLDVMKEELPDARKQFERALELQPHNPHYLLHYGVLLMRLGDNAAALDRMREAEKLDRTNPLTHYNLGRLYREMGHLEDAEHELRDAIRLRPEFAGAHYVLAGVYRLQGRRQDTASELAQFTKFKRQNDDGDPIDASLSQ